MTKEEREQLIKRLEELRDKENRAALATLRRALSGQLEDTLRAFQHIGYSLPSREHDQDTGILIGALFALHPREGGGGNMGDHVAALRRADENKTQSAERWFTALITSHRDDLPTALRQIIGLLESGQIPVNWAQLLYDLDYWDHEQHFVQRQWASAFWQTQEK